VNRSGRKFLLNMEEKIILQLLSQHRFYQDADAPVALTQDGIAAATGIGRNNISRIVNNLSKEGDVEIQSKHVKGLPSIRRVHFLTPKGFQKALKLKDEIETTRVKVIDFDGKEKVDEVGKLNIYLPRPYSLLELTIAITRGRFDCSSFHEMKIKEERRFVDFTDRKPTIRLFTGRERELSELSDFLTSENARIMVVHGIPGIGKTTLLAKFAQDIRDRTNVFWYRVHEWMTLKVLLDPLAKFLSQLGRRGLERFLAQNETPGIGDITNVASTDLKDLSALIILDDIQKADKTVTDLLSALVGTLDGLPGIRVVCASREIPSFYTRSSVFSGVVKELALEGLDKKSSVQIMKRRAIPEKYFDGLYKVTKGHPLFLELIEEPGRMLDKNVRMFIEQEVYSRLDLAECRILEIASVFRYPVNLDAFFVMEEEIAKGAGEKMKEMKYEDYFVDYDTIDGLLTKSLLQESIGRMIGMHDLIRDFFYNRLPPRQRAAYHKAASNYYLRDNASPSRVEGMYHALMAGDYEVAIKVAAGGGREIIGDGYATAFGPLLEKLLAHREGDMGRERLEILLLRGEIEDLQGDWDEAITRYRETLSLASAAENKKLMADLYRRIGVIALKRAKFEESFELLSRSMSIAKDLGDDHILSEVYYDMGGICERRGRFQEALSYFTMSNRLARSLGDDVGLGKALHGLGRVYTQLLEHENAIEYKGEALQVLEKTGEIKEIAKVCTSLGNDLWVVGRTKESLEMQERAIDLANSAGDLNTIGYAMSNAAAAYLAMGDQDKTEELLDDAVPIFGKLNDRVMIATMHLYRGYLHNLKKEWEWAKEQFKESLDILRQLDVPTKLGHWLFEISQVHLENGEYDEARELLEEAFGLATRSGNQNLRREVEVALNRLAVTEKSALASGSTQIS
jgi:tetratricopeptide (TPR) repeat protein/DNA-binding MarR family transcriptional regulator